VRRIEVTQGDDPTEEVIAVALVFEGADDFMFLDMFRHLVGKTTYDGSYTLVTKDMFASTPRLSLDVWRDQLKTMYDILHPKVR
jgi:hypothetical protein